MVGVFSTQAGRPQTDMSIEAISFASRIVIKRSSVKFVLIALADCADAAGRCWPSTDHVMRFTCLDRKTVTGAIDKLEEMTLVTDTGRRAGRTKQVKVYELNLALMQEQSEFFKDELKRVKNGLLSVDEEAKTPQKERGQKTEAFRKVKPSENAGLKECKPPVFSDKAPQKRGTEPSVTITKVDIPLHPDRTLSPPTGTEAGRACKLMRGVGCIHTNPSFPMLLEALAAGVTPEVLRDYAITAVEKKISKPFNYAIAAALNDRMRGPQPRAGPNTSGRPSMNADFTNANYQGTPNDQLPAELRKPARGITPFDPDAIDS